MNADLERIEKNTARLRDIGLLVLGACLDKETRARVLASLAPGATLHEIEHILDGLRAGDSTRFREWLVARQVRVEGGCDGIAAVVDALKRERVRQAARATVMTLSRSAACDDPAELIRKLDEAKTELEGLL